MAKFLVQLVLLHLPSSILVVRLIASYKALLGQVTTIEREGLVPRRSPRESTV
jgi:hypothetical protein